MTFYAVILVHETFAEIVISLDFAYPKSYHILFLCWDGDNIYILTNCPAFVPLDDARGSIGHTGY